MIDTNKGHYLELEQKLHALQIHFDLCKGAKNEEVLDWAKFFLSWSQKASKTCGPWSQENLKTTESFVRNLEKSKVGLMGYEVLERTMAEAYWNLHQEILKALKKRESQGLQLKAIAEKILVTVPDSQGLVEDLDLP